MVHGYESEKERWLETRLQKAERERSDMALCIERLNDALKTLIEQREIEKRAIEENLINKFKQNVLPYIEKVAIRRGEHSEDSVDDWHQVIRQKLSNLSSRSQSPHLSPAHDFNPNEAKILNLIRQGKQTKEIADLLSLAPSSVFWYRNQIRKKLGLTNSKASLRAFLNNSPDNPSF